MAKDLEVLWQRLSLTEEEDENIVLGSNSTNAAKERGVQIMEIEEEIYMVEFGDEKDKKKVLEMSPWSYEKQLILLHDFDGKQVHIHNLPLKSRTMETGLAIGKALGEVMEVEATDSGVHWGKCLRVRVNMDVTKQLVRGKKVAIKEEEKRWVIFKYERLPNFCYNCSLLSHDLRDCPASLDSTKLVDSKELQYGPWLRGEIIKRSFREKMSSNDQLELPRNPDEENQSHVTDEAQTPRGSMVIVRELRAATVHLGKSIVREETNKTLLGKESMENLHENREVNHGTSTPDKKLPVQGIEGKEDSEK
ncbi:hypothetical protein SO802_003692 [Lithocarpus litseifolius]|uniref:Zinc knuckle CX2CX4HX4C domain-containing protein n=1 Tax=Lithocarpus litseifolius TaxID=425828 RepID=A0AAW2E0Y4_9ROSI